MDLKRLILVSFIVSAIGAVSCGSETAAPPTQSGGCPNDLPSSCPSPEPSYAADVAPIIESHCAPCHAPGGVESTKPLVIYDDVYSRRSSVLNQVYSCKMPLPADAGGSTLSGSERSILLAWLICGAPND